MAGFTEVDLASHPGNAASGEFAYSLNVTDLDTPGTETQAVLGGGETAVTQARDDIEATLAFRRPGIDSDPTTARTSSTGALGGWRARRQIQSTRSRPCKRRQCPQRAEEPDARAQASGVGTAAPAEILLDLDG